MNDTARSGAPSLEQGCLLSVGVVALAFGGCVLAGSWDAEWLFNVSFFIGGLAALVGLILLIARMARAIGRR